MFTRKLTTAEYADLPIKVRREYRFWLYFGAGRDA